MGIRRRLNLPSEPPPPLVYTPLLIFYVGLVCVAAIVLGAKSWQPASDLGTMAVGIIVIIGMGAFAVRTISGVDAAWSAAVFVHLALALALGPLGAIAAGLADGLVGRAFVAAGWVRSIFNTSTFVLTNLGAWWAAQLAGPQITPKNAALAGLLAGLAAWAIDHVLLAVVISIASHGSASVERSLRSGLTFLPHTLASGWAAAGVALLHAQAGTVGFTMLLVPVLSAQAFLVLLARRTNAHYGELRLAEERERRRIARDLHDSVVQVVVGYSMRLSAAGATIAQDFGPAGEKWSTLMETAGKDLRGAARDLRTLIIQIAPPSLKTEGLSPALQALIAPLQESGVEVHLDVAEPEGIRQGDRELVFRVAQEALRNVAAHANAAHVIVEIWSAENEVRLTIVDDGSGFSSADVEGSRREGHVGTRGLEEVAADRGATLTINSTPGRGTRLNLTIPQSRKR